MTNEDEGGASLQAPAAHSDGDCRQAMLAHRAILLERHPEIRLAYELGPLMGEHEREYWLWTVETMTKEINRLRGPKYIEIQEETRG